MASNYDKITMISFIKVVDDGGFPTATGVSKGLLAVLEDSNTDHAIGIYGNELDSVELFNGEDRSEVVFSFIEAKEKSELGQIWGADKETSFYTELVMGAVLADFDDFEYENDLSVQVADAENEIDFDDFVGSLGLSIASMEEGQFQFDPDKRVLIANGAKIGDLGSLHDELQFEGEVRTAIVT